MNLKAIAFRLGWWVGGIVEAWYCGCENGSEHAKAMIAEAGEVQ